MVLRNFLFHRVSDEKDPMWPPMQPVLFDAIIKHLVKKFSVVPLEKYLQDPKAFSSTKNLATVLFDDGYKDNISFAAPILEKYSCPASFYVVTDCIDRNLPTWTYLADHFFQQTKKEKMELDFSFVPDKFRLVVFKEKEKLRTVKPWMKGLSNNERLQVMQAIEEQCDDVAIPGDKMMDWDDIRQLQNKGFIIGSHSHTHPMLASLQNEEEIRDELTTSQAILERELNEKPLTISYPIGSFDNRVIGWAKQIGYRYGLAVEQKFYNDQQQSLFEIPRVELYQEPWWKQQMRISGLYSRLKKVWR